MHSENNLNHVYDSDEGLIITPDHESSVRALTRVHYIQEPIRPAKTHQPKTNRTIFLASAQSFPLDGHGLDRESARQHLYKLMRSFLEPLLKPGMLASFVSKPRDGRPWEQIRLNEADTIRYVQAFRERIERTNRNIPSLRPEPETGTRLMGMGLAEVGATNRPA